MIPLRISINSKRGDNKDRQKWFHRTEFMNEVAPASIYATQENLCDPKTLNLT